VSYHAGSFICNETYYRALQKWRAEPLCKGVVFVHVPGPENYAALAVENGGEQLDEQAVLQQYAAALTEAITFFADQ
jgi:pyrrolidone-carboxylate peptidase